MDAHDLIGVALATAYIVWAVIRLLKGKDI